MNRILIQLLRFFETVLVRIDARLDHLEQMMSDETAASAHLAQAVADLQAQDSAVVGALDNLEAQVQNLKDAIAALQQQQGVPVPEVENAANLVDQAVQDFKTTVATAEPPAPAPVPEPTPEPTGGFVAKIEGESYADYVARATAASVLPLDESDWDALPVG